MGRQHQGEDAQRTLSSDGSMDASTFAPIKVPGRTAPTRPLDRAISVATATGRSKVPSLDAAEAAQRTGPPGPEGGGGGWPKVGQENVTSKRCERKNALGAFLEEAEREIGSSYEATVWRNLEDGT